jgi:hypothetical protein
VYEFSSLLKFVEQRFVLDPLTDRDALANDMLDSFDSRRTLCRRLSAASALAPLERSASPPRWWTGSPTTTRAGSPPLS